ncbi:MAG: WD40 repeat domain-containing serine/threonine protein kinase [Verrucomicrobiales bacterium]|nr:WD40 repeat domain-containing serine/threonine protein kinase [Verrucomicrobiales bacterium]
MSEEIARGGMGIVYRAWQKEPGREIALKMLLPHRVNSPGMAERFRLEDRALSDLEHPAILPVYQVGEHEGLPYFTMKLASGGTLAQRKAEFVGDWRAIAELVATLADAVQFAHQRGVLHRDLKPGNILFDEGGRAYVSDFGLAKLIDAETDLTRTADFLGTPHYVAPEVASRSARSAIISSDIYSLGAIFYELLAGRPPFEAEGVPALLKKIAEEEPRRISDFRFSILDSPREARAAAGGGQSKSQIANRKSQIPTDLDVICLKCLSKEPSRRYGSALELADDLRRWLAGRTIKARPAAITEYLWRWAKRNPALAAVSILLLLALAGGALLQARTNRQLRVALGGASAALQESLLTQARLERTSGKMGQRFRALELVRRASTVSPEFTELGGRFQPSETAGAKPELRLSASWVALRTEAAGALALPDLRLLERWRTHPAHFEGAAEFSEDLSRFVTASPSGGFSLFATEGQDLIRSFPGATNLPAVDFKISQDLRWIAANFQDGHAEIHSVLSNSPARSFPGHRDVRTQIEFVPDGRSFLVAGLGLGITQHHFDGGGIRVILPAPTAVAGLKLDSSGSRVAVKALRALNVIQVSDGTALWSRPWTNDFKEIAWSRDGQRLAVADQVPPFRVLVFDANTGEELAAFQDHENHVHTIAWHPNGDSLISVGWDRKLVWRQLRNDGFRLVTQADPRILRFSPDGRQLAFEPAHGQVALMEATLPSVFHEWQPTAPRDEESFDINVSRDGTLVATSSARGVHLWDTLSRKQIDHIAIQNRMWWVTVHLNPDVTSLFYSGVGLGVRNVKIDRTRLGNSGPEQARFGTSQQLGEGTGFILEDLAPDGRSLVVAENRKLVRAEEIHPVFWLWPDGKATGARKLAEDFPATGYTLTRDGRWGITTHLTAPDVWIWNATSAERVRSLGVESPAGVTLSPDGRWLLVATVESYQLWEVGSWRPAAKWPSLAAEQGRWAAAFSSDSQFVAVASPHGMIEIRTVPQATEMMRLPPPQPILVQALHFTPDDRRLLILHANGRVLEWNLAALQTELASLRLGWH